MPCAAVENVAIRGKQAIDGRSQRAPITFTSLFKIQGLLTHMLIRERLATVQRSSSDQLSGDTAILKEYLKSKGVPSEASEELDTLRRNTGKSWRAAVAKISELPED